MDMGNQGLNMAGRQQFDAEAKASIMGTGEPSLPGGDQQPLRLWYTSPAAEWNEALPIGNGRLGGMVFGRTDLERVQLNEDSLWYGGPGRGDNPNAIPYLGDIRQLLQEGRQAEAEHLARMAMTSSPKYEQPYQPLGDLLLKFLNAEAPVTHYERELDLRRSMAAVTYTSGGITYRRQYFASAPDGVLAIRLTADRPGALTFAANLMRRPFDCGTRSTGNDTLIMKGEAGADGVTFCAALRGAAEGGNIRIIGDFMSVEGADAVTLLLTAQTSFRCRKPEETCLQQLDHAASIPYERLVSRHVEEYREKFGRFTLKLELGSGARDYASLPTDHRLNLLKERVRGSSSGADPDGNSGADPDGNSRADPDGNSRADPDGNSEAYRDDDPGLIELYVQYGRYLLLSSSRPGSLAANLQGIWNDSFTPPWESKYTINANIQMNYWPAELLGLPECHEPLFDLIHRMLPNGRKTRRSL